MDGIAANVRNEKKNRKKMRAHLCAHSCRGKRRVDAAGGGCARSQLLDSEESRHAVLGTGGTGLEGLEGPGFSNTQTSSDAEVDSESILTFNVQHGRLI